MITAVASGTRQHPSLQIRAVSWSRPFTWLARGWRDLRQHAQASLAHGAMIAGLWLMFLAVAGTHPYVIAGLISGFMLIAPVLSGGLCELSRRQGSGEAQTFEGSAEGVAQHAPAIMRFGGLLAVLTVCWFLTSVLLLNTVFHRPEPTLGEVLYGGFLGAGSLSEWMDWLVIGGALALVVLAMSVVAVPMILDLQSSAGEALRASLRATFANLPAMVVWSALLVALVAIGFATFLLGLVVVVPVMGHATWHAYLDLVDSGEAPIPTLRQVA